MTTDRAITHDEREVVPPRPWSVDRPELDIAEAETLPVFDLANFVGQLPASTRPGEHRDPEAPCDRLRARRVVGVDMRQRHGRDRAAGGLRDLDRPLDGWTGRVAGIDEDEPAAADEVGTDGLAGHAATGRHDDPRHVRGKSLDLDPSEWAGRQAVAKRSIDVACSSCWSVALVGSHIPSRPSAMAASASVGRTQE